MSTLFDVTTHKEVHAPDSTTGAYKTMCKACKVIATPCVGLVYFLAMPFIFVFFVGSILIYWAAGSFGWRPSAAYLAGRARPGAKDR